MPEISADKNSSRYIIAYEKGANVFLYPYNSDTPILAASDRYALGRIADQLKISYGELLEKLESGEKLTYE